MTPGARLAAATELLDQIIAAARDGGAAADTLIARYFRDRRYAGSKDRRAVRELVYDVIRALGERPSSGRAAMIGYARAHQPELLTLFDGVGHAPAPVSDSDSVASPGLAPLWLTEKLRGQFGTEVDTELAALVTRAPLDLRVNRRKADVAAVQALFPESQAVPGVPAALRLAQGDATIEQSPAFAQGWFEVQDAGSQMIALACAAKPGATVIDLCAGAGGKTLALAADMAGQGRLIACDSDRARLSRLQPRAARAGESGIETRLLDPGREWLALSDLGHAADVVLVDAPCSGTGTWRRNPEARWRLTPERLTRLVALQARLLDLAAQMVRPGGRLVYAVCSLLPEEGQAQAQAFFARHPDWQAAALPLASAENAATPGTMMLTPLRHGCDGFFIAAAQAPC